MRNDPCTTAAAAAGQSEKLVSRKTTELFDCTELLPLY